MSKIEEVSVNVIPEENLIFPNEQKQQLNNKSLEIKVYSKRWLMLALFCSYSFTNAYQWIHLNIVADKVIIFWNSSLPESYLNQVLCVDWLSMVYMAAYIPLILPANWLLFRYGLRMSAILATGLNALGAALKCLTLVTVDGGGQFFPLLLFAQTLCATGQVFILGIPACLAATWFGHNQVSSATAIGVFGNQLGVSFGFLLPPLMLDWFLTKSPESPELISMAELHRGFSLLFISGAIVTSILFVLVLLLFQARPPSEPSLAQINRLAKTSDHMGTSSFLRMQLALLRNRNFVLLAISYGLNTGIYYALGTLLNQVLSQYYKNQETNIGWAGFVMVVAGIFGAVISGLILDRTKQFKWTTIALYFMSMVGMLLFTWLITFSPFFVVFILMFFLGFFMTGILPVGFEFAAELSYPVNEASSSGVLNMMSQLFGICLTLSMGTLNNTKGTLYGNGLACVLLIVGLGLTLLIRSNLRRQQIQVD